jgi:hypothetical protein
MSRIENAQEAFISCEVGNARSRSQSGLAQQPDYILYNSGFRVNECMTEPF